MPISSYVVRCAPGSRAGVLHALRAMPGVETGEVTGSGIAVVVDTPTARAAEESGEQLVRIPGVVSAVLVYHNFEDLPPAVPGAGASHANTHENQPT